MRIEHIVDVTVVLEPGDRIAWEDAPVKGARFLYFLMGPKVYKSFRPFGDPESRHDRGVSDKFDTSNPRVYACCVGSLEFALDQAKYGHLKWETFNRPVREE